MSVRRAAVGTAPARAGDVGAVDGQLRAHSSHQVADGVCVVCGTRSSWPRIEGVCGNRVNDQRGKKRSTWGGLSEAQVIARRAARLRGER